MLVRQRLLAGAEVDDAQAAVTQADMRIDVEAVGVGPRCTSVSFILCRSGIHSVWKPDLGRIYAGDAAHRCGSQGAERPPSTRS